MYTIELALLAAWKSVYPKLLSDPDELARRLARRSRALLQQPPRAWCVAIRASDTRINPATAILNPEYATDPHDPTHRGNVIPHKVILKSKLLRKLCAPVRLAAPGETWQEVAKKLGVGSRVGLYPARIKNVLQAHYVRVKGKPTALLYTDQPLDPSTRGDFAAPDPLWSWTAASLFARVPDEFEQTLGRVPNYRPARDRSRLEKHPELDPVRQPSLRLPPVPPDYVWYKWKDGVYVGDEREQRMREAVKRRRTRDRERLRNHPRRSRSSGSLLFRGWRWICPQCNRKVRVIYLPLPPVNLLAESGQLPESGPLSLRERVRVRGREGSETGCPTFACYRCHQVNMGHDRGRNRWNYVVSHLSGGLLYGSEVKMPDEFRAAPAPRRRYSPQATRPAPRRQQVLARLLDGWTIPQIAAEMRIQPDSVHKHIGALCKQESVPDRAALIAKMGGMKGEKKLEPQMNTDERRSEAA